MSGIYNWICTLYIVCTFVHLYICIDYSGGSGCCHCCVRACEVRRYLECCVRGVVFSSFLLFFGFGFGRGKGKGKKGKSKTEKKGKKKTLTIDEL